jgi:hypothetical protein
MTPIRRIHPEENWLQASDPIFVRPEGFWDDDDTVDDVWDAAVAALAPYARWFLTLIVEGDLLEDSFVTVGEDCAEFLAEARDLIVPFPSGPVADNLCRALAVLLIEDEMDEVGLTW